MDFFKGSWTFLNFATFFILMNNDLINEICKNFKYMEKKIMILESLLKKDKEKIQIIHEKIKKGKISVRKFNNKYLEEYQWLYGNKTTLSLHCLYCLLFSNKSSSWTDKGFTDLKNIKRRVELHEKSENHIKCTYNFINQKENKISLEKGYGLVKLEREGMRKAREHFEKFKVVVDVALYLIFQGLSFRGHNESADSVNKGNFLELFNLLSKNTDIKNIEEVFPLKSSKFQNNLIESIYYSFLNKIIAEIQNTKFLCLICDEGTDSKNNSQLSISLRYTKNGVAIERFIKFINLKEFRSAEEISKIIIDVGKTFDFSRKLVSQVYDGAPVMSGKYNGVRQHLEREYKNVFYVHCNAHMFNLLYKKHICNDKLLIKIMNVVILVHSSPNHLK